MRRSGKTYTTTEHCGFSCGGSLNDARYQELPKEIFGAFENFALANSKADGADGLLSLSARRGIKTITAKNHVGIITTRGGATMEILPKIAGSESTGSVSQDSARRIFIGMLRTLREAPFKTSALSNLGAARLDLFEVFVKMFLDEVSALAVAGLKSAYTPLEENGRFLKGKLLPGRNMKHNLADRSRFFIRHDDYCVDRPENRLIKSTLELLLRAARGGGMRHAARLIAFFDGADFSRDHDADFSKCIPDRGMAHYGKALSWCQVFLRGRSFSAFSGSEIAFALLFQMEKVFESFVAAKFRRHICGGMRMRTQDGSRHLFENPRRRFAMRPDIVLEFENERPVIFDTKWKLLDDGAENRGISQPDMYQAYVYGKKYGAERVVLLYPKSAAAKSEPMEYCSGDGVKVEVRFIDLNDADACVKNLIFCPRERR